MKQKEVNLDSVELFASPKGTLIIRSKGKTKEQKWIEISKEFFCQMIANHEVILKDIEKNDSSFSWE
jgi:hypothetical protein